MPRKMGKPTRPQHHTKATAKRQYYRQLRMLRLGEIGMRTLMCCFMCVYVSQWKRVDMNLKEKRRGLWDFEREGREMF